MHASMARWAIWFTNHIAQDPSSLLDWSRSKPISAAAPRATNKLTMMSLNVRFQYVRRAEVILTV